MIVSLSDLKEYLNLDQYAFNDQLLIDLENASANSVQKYIDKDFSDFGDEVPETLKLAIKIMVANFFYKRESISLGGSPNKVPHSLEFILDLYRNYHGDKEHGTTEIKKN